MAELKIHQIDILKIDTEGFEMEVLKGSINTLKLGIIQYIYCEVGFNDELRKTDLHQVNEFLKSFNFKFCGLYDTARTSFNTLPVKFSNALFQYQK